MKLKEKAWQWIIVCFSIFISAVWWIHAAYMNQQGYCSATGGKLSDQQKIDRAISTLLSYYPKERNALVLQYSGELGPAVAIVLRRSVPLQYKDREHFKQLNKDCCRVVSQPLDIEDAPATFFDRVTGAKSSFIEVNYLLRYVDALGGTHERLSHVSYAITNCGVVWGGF